MLQARSATLTYSTLILDKKSYTHDSNPPLLAAGILYYKTPPLPHHYKTSRIFAAFGAWGVIGAGGVGGWGSRLLSKPR